MSTDIAPPQPPPAEGAPAAPDQPRNADGTYAAPAAPPIVAPPESGIPIQPVPDIGERAQQLYQRLSDPRTAVEQILSTSQQHGLVPEGMTPDQFREAISFYQEYQQALAAQGVGMPPAPAQPWEQPFQPGAVQPGAGGQPPFAGQQPPMPGQPWQPEPFDPQAFRGEMIDAMGQLLDQREQQAQQQAQIQAQQQANVSALQGAVGKVVEKYGLPPDGADRLIRTVAQEIDMQLAPGQQLDISVRPDGGSALADFAENILLSMAGPTQAQQVAQHQQQVAQHRAAAPLTMTPQGPAQSGSPGGPRGLAGAAARIAASRGQA